MDTIERFRLFEEKVEDLRNTRMMQARALEASLNISWDGTGQVTSTLALPNEDDLRAFLMTFRHFHANDEPAHLGRIFNLLHQELTDDHLREQVQLAHQHWKTELNRSAVRMAIDDLTLKPVDVANMVLNGSYFHSDEEHRAVLKSLPPVSRDITYAIFLDFLVRTTVIVIYVGNVVSHCLKNGLFKSIASTP